MPFVPVSGGDDGGVRRAGAPLGERVGRELGIPVYLYENAASSPARRNLADIRAGEYEGLAAKLADPAWQPDFGPATFVARSGASVIGARPFLVAYNVNLNTVDKRLATRIAFDIREKGRRRLDATGQPVKDAAGAEIWDPGLLAGIKAVGWTIPEFGCAQISINVTDLDATPLHVVFDTCEERARAHGLRVTGSELVGLVPRAALLAAGRHYLARMGRSTGVPESALIHVAVRTLGLSEVKPFDAQKRGHRGPARRWRGRRSSRRSLAGFADELSSDSPAPGGGSVAAYAGALAAGLATMVANLSHPKRGFEAKQPALERIAVRGQALKDRLLAAVDADTAAFDQLPRGDADAEGECRGARPARRGDGRRDDRDDRSPPGDARSLSGDRRALPRDRRDRPPGLALRRRHRRRDGAGGGFGRLPERLHQSARSRGPPGAASPLLARADVAWARTRDLAAQAEAKFVDGLRQAAG